MPSFEGNLLTQQHDILSQQTVDFVLWYGKNPESKQFLLVGWWLRMICHRALFLSLVPHTWRRPDEPAEIESYLDN